MRTIKTRNNEETSDVGGSLGKYLKAGVNILLDGDLAAGKTVFSKGVGKGLGVKEHVKSPSYTLLCIYNGRLPMYHFDAYNLEGIDDFYDLGFEDYLSGDGVAVIEWATIIKDGFPDGCIHVEILKTGNDTDEYEEEQERTLIFTASDQFHEGILKEWFANEYPDL